MRVRRIALFVVRAIVAFLLVTIFVVPLLGPAGLIPAFTLATLIWIGATLAPWRPFWRAQLRRGQYLRAKGRARAAVAAAILTGGAATCIASDYSFGSRMPDDYGSGVVGVPWDLAIAMPFALLAALVLLAGMSFAGAAVTALILGALCSYAYYAFDTSTSSTAAIALLAPWTAGFPLVVIAFGLDAAARGAREWWKWRRPARGQ
jgi:hypothetical protein